MNNKLTSPNLFSDVCGIIEQGRQQAYAAVNKSMIESKHPILAVFPTNKQPLYVWQQIRVVCYLQFEGSIFVSSSSVMSSNGFERISFIHSYGSMSASLQHAMKV